MKKGCIYGLYELQIERGNAFVLPMPILRF